MSVFKFGTLKSPPRRPTVQGSAQSPFCTSPSQLQEVTWDPGSSGNGAVPCTLGLLSPGKTSPVLGRTVKEYEEQLTQLKKENFNLKLRIYFLDERMGQMNMNRVEDKDDHAKEDFELKVTCESLQTELLIKQDLVIQASKAMDVLEEQYRSELKKLKEEHDKEKRIFDSCIQELENELKMFKDQAKEQKFLNLKSTCDIHSQEEIEQLKQEIVELTSQVETMKLQQKRRSDSSREKLDLLPLQRKSSSTQAATVEGRSSAGERTHLNSDVSLKEKQSKTMEEWKKEDPFKYEAMQLQLKELELQLTEATDKLRKAEELKKQEYQFNQTNEERIKAYQAIKGFMKKNKDLSCELEQLKLEIKKKDHCIHDLTSELKELRDACNKANWEAGQLQAQVCVQGSCGKPGTFEDVRDMTEEENERLWAELEDKKKKLAEVITQRDNFSTEMVKQAQNLIASLEDKVFRLKECERTNAALSSELENRDKHIKELNEELIEVEKKLKVIEKDLQENSRAETQDKKDSKEKQERIKNLKVELEDKKKEVELLKLELRKRNCSMQELLNKELRDKNKEIESLQECGRKKQMEVMLLKQKLDARAFQLHLLQQKVTELGVQATSRVLREMQQPPQIGAYLTQHMQMAGDAENNLKEQLQASWEDKKLLCQRVEELQQQLRNTPERDSDSRALRSECARLREELQKVDSWHRDATEVCSKLTQRLEELSMFLAALLKHPEQLNGLSLKRRLMLSQAVERSMEMSRSLSVTLSATDQVFSETTMLLLNDSVCSIFMASDLNISELFKESIDNVKITGNNEENLAVETHVEGNNNTENVNVKILEQAELVNNLQLQGEAQPQEVKQDNKEKEVLRKIVNKISLVSADSVQKSETEDNNSLSSMTFYNSRIVGNGSAGDAVILSEDRGPDSSLASDVDIIESSYPFTAFCQGLRLEIQPKHSQPVPGTDIIELSNRLTASCQTFTPPKFSPPKKGTKVACVNKMRRSSSASAVPFSQVAPAMSKKEQGLAESLSDSEAWSEPDRSVSLARIGLSEEGTNIVISPCANSNVDVGASYLRKTIQMEDNSSDSSEETTREIIRNPGKRARSEAAEIRRLQNRLETLENLNEVLKAELSLMNQLTPHGNKSVLVREQNMSAVNAVDVDNSASVLKSPSKNVDTNANQSVSINEIETKEDKHKVELQEKSTNTSPVMNKNNMEHSTNTESRLDLLDQIRLQREKLELSLLQNNLIRYHLENACASLISKEDSSACEACKWLVDAADNLEEDLHEWLRQEYRIKELSLQLEQSVKQIKLANEELQVAQNTVRGFQERANNLETLLKEHESNLSDQQCLISKIDGACKEKSIELEKMQQEKRKLKEDYTKQLQEIRKLKKESDGKLQEALKIQEDAKIKLAEMEVELSDYKMVVERQNFEKATLQKEKEDHLKKFERMLRVVSDQKDDAEYQNREVRKKIQRAEIQKLEAERMMMEMQQMSDKFKQECKTHLEVTLEKERRDLERQLKLKVCEVQQKLEESYRKKLEANISDYEAKIKEQEKKMLNQAEDKIKALEEEHKKIVIDLKKQIQERENYVHTKEMELTKKLDEALLLNSKVTLEKTRVANEKLHLEKELRRQESVKYDLIHERKEAENSLSALKEKMEKQKSSVHHLGKDKRRLESLVKDLETINDELLRRLCTSHSENLQTVSQGDITSGNESTPSNALSSASPRSFSSGLDGGSTGPVSLETNISVGDDQNFGPGSLSTLPNLILQKGIVRQRSEPSDNMSDDQPLEGNVAAFSQMKKSEMDGTCVWVAEQHSTTSSSNARNLTSPDLGIESDQGRFSSLEASNSAPPQIRQSESVDIHDKGANGAKDYELLERENLMLRQRLCKTRHALQQTAQQLSEANERKKEVEKAIYRQLNTTQVLLTQTRVNLEVKVEEYDENPI